MLGLSSKIVSGTGKNVVNLHLSLSLGQTMLYFSNIKVGLAFILNASDLPKFIAPFRFALPSITKKIPIPTFNRRHQMHWFGPRHSLFKPLIRSVQSSAFTLSECYPFAFSSFQIPSRHRNASSSYWMRGLLKDGNCVLLLNLKFSNHSFYLNGHNCATSKS